MMKTQPAFFRVLDFWFGPLTDNDTFPVEKSRVWFNSEPADDAEIKKQFEPDIQKALAGGCEDWEKSPRGALALILLLDQMTRNIYRESSKAFEGDTRACLLASEALKRKIDQDLLFLEKWFLYMPFMHSENLEIQKLSVSLFKSLSEESPPSLKLPLEQAYDYAVRHYQVIERFGRFPHRNSVLGRVSTPNEIDFLKLPGSSF